MEGNTTILCPLYSYICNKTSSSLCLPDNSIDNVRIEQGVPGLKNWQLSGKLTLLFLFSLLVNSEKKSI